MRPKWLFDGGVKLFGTRKAMPLAVVCRCSAFLPRECVASMVAVAALLWMVQRELDAVPAAEASKSSQNR
jgi:hypothetical protein